MLARCYDPRTNGYSRYGAKGITVSPAWRGPSGFQTFLLDMAPRPAGTTLDRIDNAKGYEPGNTRWATPTEQNRNARSTRLTVAKARAIRALVGRLPLRDIAAAFEVGRSTIWNVLAGRTWRDEPIRCDANALPQLSLFNEIDPAVRRAS